MRIPFMRYECMFTAILGSGLFEYHLDSSSFIAKLE